MGEQQVWSPGLGTRHTEGLGESGQNRGARGWMVRPRENLSLLGALLDVHPGGSNGGWPGSKGARVGRPGGRVGREKQAEYGTQGRGSGDTEWH